MSEKLPTSASAQSTVRKGVATVREYFPADGEQVVAICKESPESGQWSAESYDGADSAGQTTVVAEVDGHVCGFLVARYATGEAEILNMAVDFSYRRRGVGTALIQRVLKDLPTNSDVFLEVRESNQAGIAFYEGHGFLIVGKRTGYYRDPEESALLLRKKLTG